MFQNKLRLDIVIDITEQEQQELSNAIGNESWSFPQWRQETDKLVQQILQRHGLKISTKEVKFYEVF